MSTAAGKAIRSAAPDWDIVPFSVSCARCGQDLRGQSEPKCPACELEFDWANACPIEHLTCAHCGYHLFGLRETRCPECGREFTWDQALDQFRRGQSDFFEYKWRQRPFRSLLWTWCCALRPGRFWRTLDIHSSPKVGPLIVVWVVAVVAFFLSIVLVGASFHWVLDAHQRYQSPQSWRWPAQPPITYFVSQAARTIDRDILTVVGIWCLALLGSLLLFMQSTHRCKLRAAHVLRAWTYTTAVFLPVWAALAYVYLLAAAYSGWLQWWGRPNILPILVLAIVYSAWAIRCAYRHHLRMPHSEGVAVSVQVITVMILLLAIIRIGGVFSTSVTMQILRAMGLM